MNYFIYIIPVAVILIVFVAGFAYSLMPGSGYGGFCKKVFVNGAE